MKYRTAYLMKSITVVSSGRMVRKPKQSAAAAGIIIPSCTSASTDSSADMHKIAKSRRLHSHRFAVAFKFCGYKYVVIFKKINSYFTERATLRVRFTAVVVA